MKITNFNKGIIASSSGSLWWGFLGTYYFQYITFVGTLEVVVHRCIWTTLILLITTTFLNKWHLFKKIISDKKKLLILSITSLLIFGNWTVWIYAVATNKIIDASFGYFIFPIISVFFGIIFLNESYNKKKLLALSLVIISVIFLLFNFQSTPWVGLIVAITWSTYNLIRKKLKVSADIGLFVESAFMTPFAIIVFYLLSKDGNNFFSPSDLKISLWLFLAGAMTLIPLYLYLKGVELAGLGPTGMIFFLAPTGQFLLGAFYYGEYLDINKLISFVIIWIAVAIYLHDLSGEKIR